MRLRMAVALLALIWMPACGGGNDAPPTSPVVQPPPPGPAPSPTPGPSGLQDPVPVVVAGADVSGIDVHVVSPAASDSINAELLGVTELGQAGTASSTGGTVRRGENKRVIMFGRGLNGSVRVSIGGPADIAVSNVRTVRSTNDEAGVAFDIAVSGAAALGARSVILRGVNDDITVFTGGIEVLP